MHFYTLFQCGSLGYGEIRNGCGHFRHAAHRCFTQHFLPRWEDKAAVLRIVLFVIAILFGLIELVALYIGLRLSRSMTRSVAQLYRATEHVERGDLAYRIHVRSRDQLATLEQSFNSMTESMATLIGEQKEKQRLESELDIAHEVQNSLFPRQFTGLTSLEVYGVCKPARSVSGDYYDFIPLGSEG